MSDVEPSRARLHRIGITEDDAQALEHLWNTEAFRLIADQRTGSLADFGYTALDSLDAIWHELEESTAHLYMQHGLTPHQAFPLDTQSRARANLWGPAADTDRVHQILSSDLPADLLIRALLVAQSPTAADSLIRDCTGNGPQRVRPEVAAVELRAKVLPVSVDACDCA